QLECGAFNAYTRPEADPPAITYFRLAPSNRRKTVFKEFKEFAMRGNVLDMAVGIIIGAAFGKIVSSLVEDVIMPPIGALVGKHTDFSNLFISLSGEHFDTVGAAKTAGVATLNYGLF